MMDDMTDGELDSICRHIEKRCVADAGRIRRLVKLGLWAERHGVFALEEIRDCTSSKGCGCQETARAAMHSLPPGSPVSDLVKQLRPYQEEINRAASKIAEHQRTLGDDRLLLPRVQTIEDAAREISSIVDGILTRMVVPCAPPGADCTVQLPPRVEIDLEKLR